MIKSVRRLMLAAAFSGLALSGAAAQSNLRIGLAEDPDVLDPTLARTYVGRIVFSSICDKLFDIDEKLNIVPQLATSHETSTDGLTVTIKLRPGVKFHDGEAFDAAAAKYSLERHLNMKGSFRKPELASVEAIEIPGRATGEAATDAASLGQVQGQAAQWATVGGTAKIIPTPMLKTLNISLSAMFPSFWSHAKTGGTVHADR
mgnify:CR=1 FL=1